MSDSKIRFSPQSCQTPLLCFLSRKLTSLGHHVTIQTPSIGYSFDDSKGEIFSCQYFIKS